MELLSVNIARHQFIEYGYKYAVAGGIHAGFSGLEGDVQVDRENHGGKDKALYAYTVENCAAWANYFGEKSFEPGAFGENLTVSAMPDELVHIGDVFRIGEILVEVTQPRIPCFKLGVKMGDVRFVKHFLNSGRLGFYLRVLEEGRIEAGNKIELVSQATDSLSIRDCMLAYGKNERQKEMIVRALNISALSEAWRNDLMRRLAAI
jgi:MOSC domain-containing protein YiiM